jgi:hypothetical protein
MKPPFQLRRLPMRAERLRSEIAQLNDTTEKNMAPKDETGAERKARYERIGKASAKTIKTMLAGTALGDKLRAKGYTWVPEKKDSSKKGG